MVISGVLLVPLFPLAVIFNVNYWNPVRFGGGVFGVEDILFAFTAGSITWAIAILPLRRSFATQLRIIVIVKRTVLIHLVSAAVFFTLWTIGVHSLTSHIIQQLALAIFLLLLRGKLWPIGITGSLGCVIGYGILISIFFLIWPEFSSQWNQTSAWTISLLGLPLGEIIWAASFGMGWPLCVAYVCDVSFVRSKMKIEKVA
jgi:hypothetical protein